MEDVIVVVGISDSNSTIGVCSFQINDNELSIEILHKEYDKTAKLCSKEEEDYVFIYDN